jgi:hypothetical protein
VVVHFLEKPFCVLDLLLETYDAIFVFIRFLRRACTAKNDA